MPRTFAEVKDIVIEFTKVNVNDTRLITLVENAIDMAFYDTVREQKWGELLVLRSPLDLTGASAGGLIECPDHIMIEEVKYQSLLPLRTWELVEKNRLVPPAPLFDKPRSYQIVQGDLETATQTRMSLEPYAGIEPADTAFISYYMVPELFSQMAAGTTITSSLWDNEVIKRAEHYVLTYFNKVDLAKEIWAGPLARMQQSKQPNEAQAT